MYKQVSCHGKDCFRFLSWQVNFLLLQVCNICESFICLLCYFNVLVSIKEINLCRRRWLQILLSQFMRQLFSLNCGVHLNTKLTFKM